MDRNLAADVVFGLQPRRGLLGLVPQLLYKLADTEMKWHPASIYDFPTAILSGLSEAVFEWCQEGLIDDPGNRPVRIVFLTREPNPAYGTDLLHALQSKVGKAHRSHLADSLSVEVVEQLGKADIKVTFYKDEDSTKPPVDQGLWYDALIVGNEQELGGWFCDDDHT